MRRGVKGSKSILGRIKSLPDPKPLPILRNGDKVGATLHAYCDRLQNVNLARVKLSIDSLKLSAAHAGCLSLSANQVGMTDSIFVMHKEIEEHENVWQHPEAMDLLQSASKTIDEGLPVIDN